jgi:peptide/nickel transport system substrate-binding protein
MRIASVFFATLFLFTVICCTPKTAAHVVRFGVTNEPLSLCPLFHDSASTAEIQGLLFRDLVARVERDGAWQTVPDLAERVPVVGDGSGDALLVDGKLRVHWRLSLDAHWSDGRPVVAADFALGLAIARSDAQATTSSRDVVRRIESFTADNDGRGFVLLFSEPVRDYNLPRLLRAFPAHLLNADTPLQTSTYCRAPVGNGAFVVDEWLPGQALRLRRNEHHVPRVALDGVHISFIPTSDGLLRALQAGEIDATFSSSGLSSDQAVELVESDARYRRRLALPTVWTHLFFRTTHPAVSDVRVRRAIALALDVKALSAAVYGNGDVSRASSFLPAYARGFLEHEWIADRGEAERLLDDAGFVRTTPNAMRAGLSFSLLTDNSNRQTERLVLLAKAALARVGVDVTVELLPFSAMLERMRKQDKGAVPDYAMGFMSWVVDDNTNVGALFRSDKIPTTDNHFVGQNLAAFRNADADRIGAALQLAWRDDERIALLIELQRVFFAEVPAIPIVFKPTMIVVNDHIQNLKPTGTTTPVAWNASTWSVRP